AVLQIQQSHFFTVDIFTNLFMFLAIYFAVEIVLSQRSLVDEPNDPKHWLVVLSNYLHDRLVWLSIAFGFALGMAVASKINAGVLALMLPAAFALRVWRRRDEDKTAAINWTRIFIYLILGGVAAFLAFRIFQPYAFSGPGFFGLKPNDAWVSNIVEQRAQAGGDADLPFALQWARRSHLFSFENLTKWGLGLPLGILAWVGFLWMGWRIFKGEKRHTLLWSWTAFYFLWQSMQFNPTMRYQLPIYPLLALTAAWLVFRKFKSRGLNIALRVVGATVLMATGLWAYAFTRIYTKDHPRVAATRWIYQNVPGPINLRIQQADGTTYQQPLPFYTDLPLTAEGYITSIQPTVGGRLAEVTFPHIQDVTDSAPKTLSLLILPEADTPPEGALARASVSADFVGDAAYSLRLDQPVQLFPEQTYYLRLELTSGALTILGAAPINETSWDDGLPLRLDGYDGFGGLYQGGLNFEMYWDDNADKLARFTSLLDQGEYIFISSNRQWATTTRVPERYPLTTAYYRALLGCPATMDVITCYNIARPDDFNGQLGYDLVQVFVSYPTLEIPGILKWQINDQFAEEAFTVYDHTKVLIFQKSADYESAQVRALLGAVDLSNVVHLTPKAAGNYEAKDLMLPVDRLEQQRANGTWSELFPANALPNRYPVIGLLLWYVFIFILGLFTYPLVRRVFPGLADKGYPLARAFGLVLLAYFPWLLGSFGVPFNRLTISLVFVGIVLLGAWQAWSQREALRREWRENRNYYLMIEGLFLAFFLFDLIIRLGNPDLWHPAKGGERPMDLSYFHAVLKSTTFPPYDPWFAGGYINYYYYGFVLIGTPVKLLGLTPTVAYNYILPTLFALVGTGAFSVGWNLLSGNSKERGKISFLFSPFVAGISASAGMILLGNLGTIRAVYQALQRMIDSDAPNAQIGVFAHLWLAMKGFAKIFNGVPLPIRVGDWYWLPSRVIPAPGDVEPITEFPLFTFLYSDLHAHMIVLPLAVLALAWILSFLLARRDGKMSLSAILLELAGAGLIIGAMRPTNTWDLYAYLPLAVVVVGYALWRHSPKETGQRILLTLAGMGALTAFAILFYQPYAEWFGQAYGKVNLWEGTHTPLSSYFTHWGLFLFVIVSWMWWEMHEWMANTPLSALNRLKPFRAALEFLAAFILAILIGLAYLGVKIGWIALPLALWAGILFLRADLDEAKRLTLFLVGTGLVLSIVVEVIVLAGDIGRMNTVFKLYLQAWTFFAISAGASLAWLLPETKKWTHQWRSFWETSGIVLLVSAILFTMTASLDKMRDRVTSVTPHTLDGMAYMDYATYWDSEEMDLSEDAAAIRWLRENVLGSPVIVEANTPEYRWGSRITTYTGLPGVVGWNWHQRQQRALNSTLLVTDRVDEIGKFYNTLDIGEAMAFIQKYDVRYIIVGQVEQIYYPDGGLLKFEQFDGSLWQEVFREGRTAIYEVVR
ncbi:MAG: DUF2298 domain-containing protein, partial [Anaerolineales bacterium]|nr:DUF2298 domain-containing protein [Anaerolineales bacterium]